MDEDYEPWAKVEHLGAGFPLPGDNAIRLTARRAVEQAEQQMIDLLKAALRASGLDRLMIDESHRAVADDGIEVVVEASRIVVRRIR